VSQIRNEKVCSAVADLRFCGLPVANSQHWELTWGKWGRLRHEGNWLGPKENGAQCPKPLYSWQIIITYQWCHQPWKEKHKTKTKLNKRLFTSLHL